MKSVLHKLKIALLILILNGLSMPSANASWVNVGPPGFSLGGSSMPCMAVDPTSGTPYVAFADGGNSYRVCVMKYNGTAWDTVGATGISAGSVNTLSFTIAGNGTPYVAYIDGGMGQAVCVKTFDGSNWVTLDGLDSVSAGLCSSVSITTDAGNVPYVAYNYQDNTYGWSAYRLSVMEFTGGAWNQMGSSTDISVGEADYISMAINTSTGYPWVIYSDGIYSGASTVAYFDGSNWFDYQNISNGEVASYTTIGFNQFGTPFISWSDASDGNQPYVYTFDGLNWIVCGGGVIEGDASYYNQLVMDNNGFPWVVYLDGSQSNTVVVWKYNGIGWGTYGCHDIFHSIATQATIALDNSNVPYVAATDWNHSFLLSVVKFNETAPAIQTQPANQNICDDVNSVNISLSSADALTFQWQQNDGTGFVNIGDGSVYNATTTNSLNISYPVQNGFNGYTYRCLVGGCYPDTAAYSDTAVLTIGTSPIVSISSTNVSCYGNADGTIIVSSLAGATITVNGSPYDSTTAYSPGTYTVAGSSLSGCSDSSTVTITQPIQVTVSGTATNVSCNGAADGTITISSLSAGASTIVQLNDTGADLSSQSSFAPGTYVVTASASDGNGNAGACSATASVTITEPVAVTVNASSTNVSCNGNADGTITINGMSAGASTIVQLNDTGADLSSQSSFAPGTYVVTASATDGNGNAGACSTTASVTITEPVAVTVNASSTNVSCNGNADGTITINGMSAGASTIVQLNDTGADLSSQSSFAPGTYVVTASATDGNGNSGACSSTVSVTITEPVAVTVSATSTNVSCNGAADGTITINGMSAGASTIVQLNDTGADLSSQSSFAPGTYVVTASATDGNGNAGACSTTASVTITEPVAVTVNASSTNVSCNGNADGTITINGMSAGASTIVQLNDTGADLSSQSSFAPGTYVVTASATDGNGNAGACSTTASVTITEPVAVTVNASSTNVSCNGAADGTITISSLSAGASTIVQLNDTGADLSSQSSFAPGTYVVTASASDGNGNAGACSATASVTITEPVAVTVNASSTNVSCNGNADGTITINGMSAGASTIVQLNDTGADLSSQSSFAPGTYVVTASATDGNGNAGACSTTASVTITEPVAVTVNASSTNVSCNGNADGTITINGMSAGASTIVQLNDTGADLSSQSAFAPGTYVVTASATDGNGNAGACSATASVTITEPVAVTVNASSTNVSCNGAADGTITISSLSAGASTIVQLNDTGADLSSQSSFAPGTYVVTASASDGNGNAGACSATASVTITEPIAVTVNGTATNVSCNGNSDGSITVNSSAGATVVITNSSSVDVTANNGSYGPDTYTLTASADDGNGNSGACTASTSVTITEPNAINASVSVSADATTICSGTSVTCTATATNGGSAPAYQWQLNGADITGATDSTFTSATFNDQDAVTCIMTSNAACATNSPATSNTITMSVGTVDTITIQSQPTDQIFCIYNWIAQFNVTSSNALNYQWQQDDGSGFTNLSDGWQYVGTGSGNLTIYYPVDYGMNGYRYRCILTGGSCETADTSTIASIIVQGIITQGATDVSVCGSGSTAQFTVASADTGVTYQWQIFDYNIYDWDNLSDDTTYTGSLSSTLNISGVNSSMNNNYYNCVITSPSGCQNNSQATLYVDPTPSIQANASSTMACSGSQVTLYGDGGYNFTWNNGVTDSQPFTDTATATYTLTGLDWDGCAATDSITVAVGINTVPVPIITAGGPVTFCNGGSVTLTAVNTTPLFQWSTGDNTSSISVAASANITVTNIDSFGCTAISLPVNVYSPVLPSATINAEADCNGNSISLSAGKNYSIPSDYDPSVECANGNYIYGFSLSGINNQNIACTANATQTYAYYPSMMASVTQGSTYAFTFTPPPNVGSNLSYAVWIDFSNDGTFTDAGDLIYTSAYSVNDWTTNPFSDSLQIPLNTASCVTRMRIRTSISNDFYSPADANRTDYGQTQDYLIQIGSAAPFTYAWSSVPAGFTSSNPYPATVVSLDTTYILTVTDTVVGCSKTTSITPDSAMIITPGAYGNNVWIAYAYDGNNGINGDPQVNLDVYEGYYTDSTLSFDSRNSWDLNTSPSSAPNYEGCLVTQSNHTVTYKRQGFPAGYYSLDIPAHDDWCYLYVNDSLVFEHDGCCDSHWGIWNGVLDSTSTINFTWIQFGGGSDGALNVNLLYTTPVVGVISGDTNVCTGVNGEIYSIAPAAGADYYIWSVPSGASIVAGDSTTSITVNFANTVETGVVTVYGVNGFGSGNVDTLNVNVTPLPAPNIQASGSTTFCIGDQVTLSTDTAASYLWSTGETTASIDVSTAGDYSVTLTNTNGCSAASNAVTVAVNSLPVVSVTPLSNVGSCTPAFNLTNGSPSGGTYSGSGVSANQFDPSTGANTYAITYSYTDTNGCSSAASTNITVDALPTVTMSSFSNVGVCNAAFALAGGSPAGGIYSGTSVDTGYFDPSIGAGTYNIIYTYADTYGCTSAANDSITVIGAPNVTLNTFSNVGVCNSALALTGGSPSGGIYSGTSVTAGSFDPSIGAGTYVITYTYTDTYGCTSSANSNITVDAAPTVTLSSFSNVGVCNSAFALSGGSPAGGVYSGTGVTAGSFDPSVGAGTYTITYTYADTHGCTSSDAKNITVVAAPVATLGSFSNVGICTTPFALAGGSPAGGVYTGVGVTAGSFDPSVGTGIYTVTYTYTDIYGCSSSDTNTITVKPAPIVMLGSFSNVGVCTSPFALAGGSPTGGVYSGTGVTAGSFNPAVGAGTYTITYTYADVYTCTTTATSTITVETTAATMAALSNVGVCNSAFALTGGSPGGGVYSGTGVTAGSFDPSVGAGTYTITYTYTDLHGCTSSANNNITVAPLPNVTLSALNSVGSCSSPVALSGGSPVGGVYSGPDVSSGTFDASAAGSGTYAIIYTYTDTYGCTGSATSNIIVTGAPVVTAIIPGSRCDAGVVNIAAIASSGTINWFADSTGGSSLATGITFTTPSISSSTMYYAQAILNSCSSSRAGVMATVNDHATHTENVSLCAGQELTVGPSTFNTTGIHTVILNTVAGCDSTVIVNMTVSEPMENTETVSLCAGQQITIGTNTYNASGTYIDAMTSVNGCDSTVTIDLTVNLPVDTTTTVDGTTITAHATSATYQWVNCDNGNQFITGATGQSYTPTVDGNYAVIVTENNCSNTSNCVDIISTGVQTLSSGFSISVYPNPNKGIFTINAASAGEVVYSIVNELGQIMSKGILNNDNNYTIDVQELSNGIYYVIGYDSHTTTKQKIVVTK